MSVETMTVTRLIPEEDLIDGLFYRCDEDKNERVPVSSLIKYLKSTVGQDKQSLTAIENLSVMLDPKGTNRVIDLVTYRKGIYQWIKEVRQDNSENCKSDDKMQRNEFKRQNAILSYPDSLQSPFPRHGGVTRLNEDLNMSNATAENSILDVSTRHFESEISELTTRVGDLQHQNRKLVEENIKLEQQLEGQEESMNTMNQDTLTLKKKIKNLQELVDLRTQTQEENEELKVSLTKYHEKRKELENRLNQQERENTALHGQIADYESKVQILSSELENASIQQKSLQSTLVEQKQLLKKLTEEKTMHEVQLLEKTSQITDLQNCVEELNKMNEDLKHEQDDLQIQLIQAQEINNFQMKDDRPNMSSSSGCVDDLEEGAVVIDEGPVSSSQSTAYSTPVKQCSIHTEIKEMLGESLHLPSPLSDKELHESFLARSNSSGGESWTTEELIDYEVTDFIPCSSESDGTTKTLDASKLIEKFQEQQEAFTNRVNEVINAVGVKTDRESYSRRLFVNSEDEDGDPETCKEQEQEKKKNNEIRYKKLMLVFKKLKGENERLVRMHDDAVESLTNWEKNMDSSVDNRLTVLRDLLLEERALKKKYQQEVESLKTALKECRQNLKEKQKCTHELYQELSELEAQMTHLRKTNLDLAEKCHKSELKISDLHDDILQSSFNLEREKQRGNEFEETLASTKLARQLDLRDIWRLVQKDVENECMEEQNDSPVSSSTDLLKEQITKEIECLKDSLVKRQVALGALKGKPMKLKLDSSGNYCQQMDISPSSPLVDALTIDFFNGNYPMARPGNKRAGTLSSLNQYSSLDRDNCAACQNNINVPSHHTLSCPSLHQRHCHHDPTVVDQHGNYSYTNLNTSSSSSTSGVDVSPRCSRSVDGQTRRRDFIRSSIKYGSGSQTSAESNANSDSSHHRQHRYSRHVGDRMHKKETVRVNVQSPSGFRRQSFTNAIENRKDSNDNNLSHFSRSRSLSFQAAIERGRRSPVDEVDFISTSTDSTPDRMEYPQHLQQEMYASSRNDSKSVSFHLSTEEFFDTSSEIVSEDTDPPYRERTDAPLSSPHDVQFSSQLNRQTTIPPARKLSTLVEEDTDQSESHSDKAITPQLIKSIVEEYATPTKERSVRKNATESATAAFSRDQVRKKNDTNAMSKTGEIQEKKETGNSKKRPNGDAEESAAKIKEKSMDKPSDSSKSASRKIPEKKMQVKPEEALVVPGSPENGLVEDPRLSPKASPKSKPESRLAKLRQNNLAKKREQMRTMKLPELREQTEGDMGTPQLLTVSEHTLTPPPPSQDTVTPSLPDEFLEKLGLKPSTDEEIISAENLPENEIESKFSSLALAFKTDKMTLEKRKGIQERSRDLAENNVEKELNGLREAAEELNQSVADAKLRDVIQRIQEHIEVLEQSAAKVSSRAEVFGAVQQEKRMSIAMEIMITYVNHLKSMYEKDHSELEEARKLLQDKPFGGQSFLDLDRSNRSMSVAALKLPHQRSRSPSPGGASKDKTRRRSEVALPRMCGGVGSPMLRHSASLSNNGNILDYPLFTEFKQHGGSRENVTDDEDPKQRFQALVGNTQMRNSVATTFRRGSLERQASIQSSKSSSLSLSRDSSLEKSKESQEKAPSKQGSQEEEAYHRGFEDGVKAKLGQELSELREKQNHIGQSLEDVMDKVEKSKEEDEREKEEAAERRMMHMRALGLHKPSWENAGHTLRLALAGLIFMIAVGMVIMTILPGSASGMEMHTDIQHFGAPPT